MLTLHGKFSCLISGFFHELDTHHVLMNGDQKHETIFGISDVVWELKDSSKTISTLSKVNQTVEFTKYKFIKLDSLVEFLS